MRQEKREKLQKPYKMLSQNDMFALIQREKCLVIFKFPLLSKTFAIWYLLSHPAMHSRTLISARAEYPSSGIGTLLARPSKRTVVKTPSMIGTISSRRTTTLTFPGSVVSKTTSRWICSRSDPRNSESSSFKASSHCWETSRRFVYSPACKSFKFPWGASTIKSICISATTTENFSGGESKKSVSFPY